LRNYDAEFAAVNFIPGHIILWSGNDMTTFIATIVIWKQAGDLEEHEPDGRDDREPHARCRKNDEIAQSARSALRMTGQ
jgi:hypothetical protein